MLFFQPEFADKEKIPSEIVPVIEALAKRGFCHPYTDDPALINASLIEEGGKFFYKGVVVGYLRALPPPEY